jgi:hypothetical protein
LVDGGKIVLDSVVAQRRVARGVGCQRLVSLHHWRDGLSESSYNFRGVVGLGFMESLGNSGLFVLEIAFAIRSPRRNEGAGSFCRTGVRFIV